MASIGYIHGFLTLSTRSFEQGIARATTVTQKFTSFLSSRLMVGVDVLYNAVMQVPRAFVAAADASARWGAEVTDLARRFNMTTDAVQELQFAANQSSISTDALARAMQTLQRVTGESASVESLIRNLRSIQALPTAAARAIEAQRLFGKSFEELLPLINGGTDALDAFQRAMEAKELTLVSPQSVASLNSLNDAWARMNDAASTLGNEVLGRLAPGMERLFTSMEVSLRFVTAYLDEIIAQVRGMMSLIDAELSRLSQIPGLQAVLGITGSAGAFSGARAAVDFTQRELSPQAEVFAPIARPVTPTADGFASVDPVAAIRDVGRVVDGAMRGEFRSGVNTTNKILETHTTLLRDVVRQLQRDQKDFPTVQLW